VCVLSERMADFAASFCTSFFGAALMLFFAEDDFIVKFFISALFVSVPTAIIKKLCYYLFAQPCLVIDRSKSGGCTECCVDGCSKLVTGMGMSIVCVWSTVFFILGLVFWIDAEATDLLFWVTGLAQFWVLWFMNMLAMQFYPFQFGLQVLKPFRKLSCGLVRFGQWHIEREQVLTIVRDQMKTRGRSHFATPGSPREAEADSDAANGAASDAVSDTTVTNALTESALPPPLPAGEEPKEANHGAPVVAESETS